jgi:hypothetical protein
MNSSALCDMFALCLIISLFSVSFYIGASASNYIDIGRFSISGTKFEDKGGDGFLNPGDPGASGWNIRLIGNGLDITTNTDRFGSYSFQNLMPGTYVVTEEPSGWIRTVPGCGQYEVTLYNKSAFNLNFGGIPRDINSFLYNGTYMFMHPTAVKLHNWTEIHRKSSQAYIDPKISVQLKGSPGDSFSLLPYLDYCPADRNQGACGNCWVWAGTAVAEIDLAVKRGIRERLSVQYFNSKIWGCDGGALVYFAQILNTTRMMVPWSNANAQWKDGCHLCGNGTLVSPTLISTNPFYPVIYAEVEVVPTSNIGKEEAIKNIKNILRQKKAIFFGFSVPDTDYIKSFVEFWIDDDEGSVYKMDYPNGINWTDPEGVGHAVVCIGYNDIDPNNRYWIMLNSWSVTPKRPNGIFRLSMDMDYNGTFQSEEGEIDIFTWETLKIRYLDLPPYMPLSSNGIVDGQRTSYSGPNLNSTIELPEVSIDDLRDRSYHPEDNGHQYDLHHLWEPMALDTICKGTVIYM